MLGDIIDNIAVLSLFLRNVQRLVRLHEQLVIVGAVHRIGGNSHRTGQAEILKPIAECKFRFCADSPQDPAQIGLVTRVLKHKQITAAAYTACESACTYLGLDDTGDRIDDLVSEKMSVTRIYICKIINVKNNKIDVILRFFGKYLLRNGSYRALVEQSRKRVPVGFKGKIYVLALAPRTY